MLPAVAVDRTAPVRTSRSTVGTMTSVADYLRALFARAATLHCRRLRPAGAARHAVARSSRRSLAGRRRAARRSSASRTASGRRSASAVVREAFEKAGFRRVLEGGQPGPDRGRAACIRRTASSRWSSTGSRSRAGGASGSSTRSRPRCGTARGRRRAARRAGGRREPLRFSEAPALRRAATSPTPTPRPALFSFNHPIGACETCKGFGRTMAIDPDLVVPDPRKSARRRAASSRSRRPSTATARTTSSASCAREGLPADVPWAELPRGAQRLVWDGEPGGRAELAAQVVRRRRLLRLARVAHLQDARARAALALPQLPPVRRLRRLAPAGRRRACSASPAARCPRWRRCRSPRPSAPSASGRCPAATPPRSSSSHEVRGRLRFLVDVGPRLPDPRPPGAHALGRRGAARRAGHGPRRLAHGHALRARRADGGPAPARRGAGCPACWAASPRPATRWWWWSTTRRSSAPPTTSSTSAPARAGGRRDRLRGAGRRACLGRAALEDGRVSRRAGSAMPRRALRGAATARTRGVGSASAARARTTCRRDRRRPARPPGLRHRRSGSGKSTLVDEVLYRNLRRAASASASPSPAPATASTAPRSWRGVTSSTRRRSAPARGSTPRPTWACSTAAQGLRRRARGARARPHAAAFSFNSAAGRCAVCAGDGYEKVEMQFLPDASCSCPACDGRRFQPEVLAVRCRGLSIADVLELPAPRWRGSSAAHPGVARRARSRCWTSASATSRCRSRRRRSRAARRSA